jgi:hypothetical protein
MKHLAVVGMFLLISLAFAPAASAHDLTVANASVFCSHYCLDLTGIRLTPGDADNISYSLTLTPTSSGPTLTFTGSVDFIVDGTGVYSTTICPPNWNLTDNYTVTGTATLATEHEGTSTLPISFGGAGSTDLSCGPPPNGKTFSIKNSMEGDLAHILPGDWISGGYSFK